MPVDKLIPQYLNKDEDVRLVENTQMTDALNIRVSTDDNGNQGVLKNVEGNSSVAAVRPVDAIPASGVNRVIGSVASEAGKCIYFFLYNSEGNHGIYQYRYTTDLYYKVYENSVLNFNLNDFVKADVVINQFDEHLLYFTDNRNEPRKINATKALNGGYSAAIDSGSIPTRELFLTVCKQPPQTPITFEHVTNPDIKFNNLKENLFQFAYQYVYDDGEVSAVSAYSKIAVSATNLVYNSTSLNFLESENNELVLTITGSSGPVTKIRVFARKNNEGAFYRISEIDNPGGTTTSITFRNDGVYPLLPDQDAFKPFDSVPRVAFTEAISNNRLFYGNYVEGFDNIETDVYNYAVYHPRASVAQFLDANIVSGGTVTSTDDGPQEVYQGPGSEAAQGNEIPPYTHFGGPDSVGGGVSFEVDLSEVTPAQINLEGQQVTFSINLECDQFGIENDGRFDLNFNVSTFNNNGTELLHSQTMSAYVGAAFEPGFTPWHDTTPPSDNGRSHIKNLIPTSPVSFSTDFVHPGGIFNKQAFADMLIEEVNGLPASVAVQPPVPDIDLDGITDLDGWNKYATVSTFAGNTTAFDNRMGHMSLRMQGTLQFQVYGGEYNADTEKIRFKVRLTSLNLDAIEGWAKNRSIFGYSGLRNGFVDTYEDGQFDNDTEVGDVARFGGNFSQTVVANINSDTMFVRNTNGDPVSDTNLVDGPRVETYWFNYGVSSGEVNCVQTGGEDTLSFKAGATHSFGIVYYDHRNRASGVQPIDNVDVRHFGDSKRSGNEGRSEVDLRLLHTPPPWATKWAPVYSKNLNYEKILQFTITEAALGQQPTYADPLATGAASTSVFRPVTKALSGGTDGEIFISMRSLEGKYNSYKEFKGAQKTYEYMEGDVLRVIEYRDVSNQVVRPMHEFVITSYEFYNDDDQNPIVLSDTTGLGSSGTESPGAFRRTGHFLTVRDNAIDGFDRNSILNGTDFFSQNCVVEIYRPKKFTEDKVYYEIGRCYDVITVDGERTHAGDRSNSSSPSFDIIVTGETSFVSTQRLYLGDRVDTIAANTGYVYVNSIRVLEDGRYRYGINSSSPFYVDGFINTVVSASVFVETGSPVSVFPGVVTLKTGDVYMRIREMMRNEGVPYFGLGDVLDTAHVYSPVDPRNTAYDFYVIEDQSASDFFESQAIDIGRPHIETPDQREIRRFSSVTYSDVFTLDNAVLNLSNFNPTLFPFKDYNTQHGDICYLLDRNESLMVMQEGKISATPISRVLIEDAGGGQLVTSQNVMGTPTYYAGDYGPGLQPESVVERFGLVYFADVSRAAVIQIGGKGIEPISSKHMDSYFQTKLGKVDSIAQNAKLPAGFDPDNTEYVLSITEIDRVTVSVPADDGGDLADVVRPTSGTTDKGDAVVDVIYAPNGGNTWDTEPDRWQLDAMNWEDSGNGILFLDRLGEKGSAILHTDYQGTTASVNIKVSVFGGDLTGVTSISPKDNSIAIPSTLTRQSDSGTVAVTQTVVSADVSGETVAWSPTKQVWLTFYSFVPELYAHLHDRFFSFVNGQIWKHNVNATMNNFYGSQYNTRATVVSKLNPSMVKVYDSISLEGDNGSWNFVVTNSTQTTPATSPTLIEKEEMWYSRIPSDSTAGSTLNTAHKVVLGQVSAIDGDTITFSSRISNLPFGIGDSLFKLESSSETDLSLTISSVSGRKEITASGAVGGLIVGDTVMAVSDNNINGDDIRDYYAQIALTNAVTTPVELYAVNTWFTPSPLHNEK